MHCVKRVKSLIFVCVPGIQSQPHLKVYLCCCLSVFLLQSTSWCFCVRFCMFYTSGIKYRPSTSDTAENVEINQISRDKWAALTGYPGKLHFSPFFGTFSGNFFGENLGIILAGAVAASLLGFSANGMKGWNVVNILGELVCIQYILNQLKIKMGSKENLTLPPATLMCFLAQRCIVKITPKYFRIG